MISFIKRLWQDRNGNALVIAAGALPIVLGSAGLATDTIQWALWKRQLQRAADSAAIAGVYAKIQSQAATSAVNTDLTKNNQTKISLLTGYPQVAELANTSQYIHPVRVTLALQKKLGFSGLFMTATPTITATATAAAIETGDYCVVSLENTSTTGITIGGTADVDLGCGMITNSTSLDAAVAFGSSEVDASPIAAVGGIDAADNWADGTQLLPFTLAQEDPFKDVYPPTTFPTSNCPNVTVNPGQTENFELADGNTQNMPSGYTCIGDLTVKGTLTLADGVYVLDGGSIDIQSQANISCSSCTFVLTNRSLSSTAAIGGVTINGGATLDLAASSSGVFEGILMYQDRRAPSGNNQNHINGNSDSFFQGAFYFPSQETVFNGTAGMSTSCVQLVARRVTFTGTSGISNNCPANSGANSFKGRHVRLVA